MHYGYSATDKLLKCIQSVYGKPVSTYPDLRYRLHADFPCPKTREGIQELLQMKISSALITPQGEQTGILLFETPTWVYVISAMRFTNVPGMPDYRDRERWKRITIATRVEVDDSISESEANALVPEILKDARMIFLRPLGSILPEIRAADDDVAVEVRLRFYKKKLRADSADAVITVIDQPSFLDIGRIAYGEVRGGKYQMLWDSPLLNSRGNIGFEDVNGDGWDEIVWQSATCGAQNCDPQQLVAFDKAGREITRQHPQECPNYASSFDDTDGVCPIDGRDIRITAISPYPGEPGSHEPKDIVATDFQDKERIYVLDHGMYALSKLSRDSLAKTRKAKSEQEAAVLNEQGMTLMKEGNYAAAYNSFNGANHVVNGGNSLYANNAGFACYKLGDYKNAISWFGGATQIDPKRAIAYLNRADAFIELYREGKDRSNDNNSYFEHFCKASSHPCIAEAHQDYQKYLELAPDSKNASDVKKKLAALPANP